MRLATVGPFGLLASANVWFFLGLALMLTSGLLELYQPRPRVWLLSTYLAALIIGIHAVVPIIDAVPEYGWVYKHIGIVQALGQYGHITDPSNIYQQWPALFSAVASISDVAHVGPLSFAAWGPVFFELTNALLLLGLFRVLGTDRRRAFLALFLYEGLICWIGQDYMSPQAFGYLLWFGILIILMRWLLIPAPNRSRNGLLARVRAPFFVKQLQPYEATRAQMIISATLIAVIFFAIVAAHQLTPYMAIAGVGALVLLGLVRRGGLLLLMMAAIALGYLAPRYGLISQQFGGIFSGGNALENASGVGVTHHGANDVTADVVHVLSVCMWLGTLVAIAYQRRELGRVATAVALAFSPFVILVAQSYGGEAIYRVYLFSAPWCALLIARALAKIPITIWHRPLTISLCAFALAAGMQGLYGPVNVETYMPAELAGSLWIYSHAAPNSLIVLAANNFPTRETADYNSYDVQPIPSDPQLRETWVNEGNVSAVEAWIGSLGRSSVYVIFSRSMAAYASYYGAPSGYAQLASAVQNRPGWSVIYRNSDTLIYRYILTNDD